MKTHTLILGLMVSAVFTGNGFVLAQESESGSHERGSGKMKKMDTDGDGEVSLDEFLVRAEQRFAKMDMNQDGSITEAEYKDKRQSVRAKNRERRQSEKNQE